MTAICFPTGEVREAVGELPDDVAVVVWDGTGEPPPGIEAVDFLVGRQDPVPLPPEVLALMPKLRVLQLVLAGVESWIGHVPDGVTLCSGRGIHGASVAELALAGMLSMLRNLPHFAKEQAAHRWAQEATEGLDGRRVLVIGPGDIGRRIAAAVEIFGAEAALVGRPQDGVHDMTELGELLPQQDIVALALPRTPATEGLVDAGFLASMRDGALLVNVARGSLVDTQALLAELRSGRLRAFLDVTDPEPLPPGHPLWDAPNLLITPHVAGGTLGWHGRAGRLVREQILRWHDGLPLANVVTDGF